MSQRSFKANVKQIETLRIARGWSIADLAGEACCSTRTIDSVMDGGDAIISTFRKIAKALKVPIESIIELSDHDAQPEPAPQGKQFQVDIKLTIPYGDFDESSHLVEIVALLKRLLKGGDFDVTDINDGSTILSLAMSKEAIEHLPELIRAVHEARDADVSQLDDFQLLENAILRTIAEIRVEASDDLLPELSGARLS